MFFEVLGSGCAGRSVGGRCLFRDGGEARAEDGPYDDGRPRDAMQEGPLTLLLRSAVEM
jgi:hypothetical protein